MCSVFTESAQDLCFPEQRITLVLTPRSHTFTQKDILSVFECRIYLRAHNLINLCYLCSSIHFSRKRRFMLSLCNRPASCDLTKVSHKSLNPCNHPNPWKTWAWKMGGHVTWKAGLASSKGEEWLQRSARGGLHGEKNDYVRLEKCNVISLTCSSRFSFSLMFTFLYVPFV